MANDAEVLALVAEGRDLMNRFEATTVGQTPVPVPEPIPEPVPVPVPPAPTPPPGTFAALLKAELEAGKLIQLDGRYRLEQPVVATIRGNRDRALWGIDGNHAVIECSGFSGPAITIDVPSDYVRGLRLTRLMMMGAGIKLSARGNLLFFVLDQLIVQSVNGHGIHLEGSVFEGRISGSDFMDCAGDAMRFEHTPDFVRHCSAMAVVAVNAVQCGRGIAVERNARDVTVSHSYFRDNKGPAAFLGNGIDRAWVSCGFENNGKSDPNAPHILAGNNILISGSSFHDAASPNRYAIRLTGRANPCSVVDCRRTGGKGVQGVLATEIERGHKMELN